MVMLTSPQRLFAALVGGGATLAMGCASQPDTAREMQPTAPASSAAHTPVSHPMTEPVTRTEPTPAKVGRFECAGEGINCTSDGVMCCWGTHPGCEPCCPDL